MKIIVLGCGGTGSHMAKKLLSEGHQVTVIDKNRSAFTLLGPGFHGKTVVGTGIDEDVLENAGIRHADVFIAATHRENTNLMAGQVAKLSFNTPQVICRIEDPAREEIYQHMGIETICHAVWEVSRVEEILAKELPGG